MQRPLLLLSVAIAFPATAQPVLNSAEMAPPGTSVPMQHFVNYEAVDTTIQGPNAVWDFSGLEPDQSELPFTLTVVDPASTPYPDLFLTDNYAYWEQPNNYYRYFEKTPFLMQRLGSYATSSYVMADPQVEYVFPLTYGTTNVDNWFGVNSGGTYGITCVGYGELTLPGITVEDALMVRVHHVNTPFYDIRYYFWYSSQDGRILVQYCNTTLQLNSLYFDADAIGVHEQTPFKPTILSNPVAGELNFVLGENTGMLDYALVSASGAIAGTGRIPGRAGSVHTIATASLRAGLYFLRLTDPNASMTSTLKFIKE